MNDSSSPLHIMLHYFREERARECVWEREKGTEEGEVDEEIRVQLQNNRIILVLF